MSLMGAFGGLTRKDKMDSSHSSFCVMELYTTIYIQRAGREKNLAAVMIVALPWPLALAPLHLFY